MIVKAARQWFERWWQARLPLCDATTLTQRNVFILPTRPGFMLGATLLVLLVASINYQLNLGYLLTFLLAGAAAAGMILCHNTLRGLSLSLLPPDPVFAGASAVITVHLHSRRGHPRYGIGLALSGSDQWVWADVPAQGSATVHVAFKTLHRGLRRLPVLTAETRFPLGTFRVWTIWRPAAQILVYPAAELSPPPLPPGEPRAEGAASALRHTSGDFDGVRAYRRGDPLKRVVWKKTAKTDELVSRDDGQAQHLELWLDQGQCGSADKELQLSRLCAWVLQAHEQEFDYGLRLSSGEIPPARGETHQRHCLQALALC